MKRPCLDCGVLIDKARRCRAYESQYQRQRGSPTRRGYDSAWVRVSERAREEQPWCTQCGRVGTRANPLGADHVVPLAHGGVSMADNVVVLCRECNSAKGARR